jgi:hypothetical protein
MRLCLRTIHHNPTCSSAIGVTHHIDRVKKISTNQTAELFSLYQSNKNVHSNMEIPLPLIDFTELTTRRGWVVRYSLNSWMMDCGYYTIQQLNLTIFITQKEGITKLNSPYELSFPMYIMDSRAFVKWGLLSFSPCLFTIHWNQTYSSAIGVTLCIGRVNMMSNYRNAALFSLNYSNSDAYSHIQFPFQMGSM